LAAESKTTIQPNKRAKSARYSDIDKARAIAVVRTMGGLTKDALREVDRLLGKHVDKSVIWHWLQENPQIEIEPYRPDVTAVIQDTRNHVISRMQSSLVKIVDRSNNDTVIEAASLKELMLSAAIAIDKLKQFAGLSPELEHRIGLLQQACNKANVDILDWIDSSIAQLEASPIDSSLDDSQVSF